MKILQVHNYYQYPGGEDIVLKNEKALLEENGHSVVQYTRHNDEIKGIRGKLNVLLNTHYSAKSKKKLRDILQQNQPDVVHVHNFFPLITPAVFEACTEMQIPSVFTLHNYRLIHPNGYLIDNQGNIDERSVKGSAYACVPGKVYRHSKIQTLLVAHMIEYHRKAKTWHTKVIRFIALTHFARSKFVEGGLPEDKIAIKPNFIKDGVATTENLTLPASEKFYVFVGRLSPEKGVEMLIDTWIEHHIKIPIYILGEGPLQEVLAEKAKGYNTIKLLGRKTHTETLGYIKKAEALIFPSTWYEGFPMTIVEALSLGTPVVSSDIGSQAEIIVHHYNGLHFQVKNPQSLAETITLLNNKELLKQLSENARESYLRNYTPEINYNQLINIYREAIQECDKNRWNNKPGAKPTNH